MTGSRIVQSLDTQRVLALSVSLLACSPAVTVDPPPEWHTITIPNGGNSICPAEKGDLVILMGVNDDTTEILDRSATVSAVHGSPTRPVAPARH